MQGQGTQRSGLVGRDGGYLLRPKSATGWFQAAVKRAAVQTITPHDLRHTCASLTLAITPNLHIVKERLGHESITTTIDIYGHLLPSVDAALMDGLGALFESAVKPPDNVRAIDRRAGAGGSP